MPEQNEKKEKKKEENQQETSKETALENTKTEDLIRQSEKIKEKILANLEELERLNDTVTKRIGELDDSIKNSERKIASLNKQVADALAKQNKNDHDMMVSYTLPAGIVVDTTVKKSMSFRKFFDKLCLRKKSHKDIVKLVADGRLSASQLSMIKVAMQRSITEKQLITLINSNLEPERMMEVIEIAVMENSWE